jgi:mediator of replication checkpoint protein 1
MASRTESPELAKREHDRTPQTDAGVELEADSIMASPSPAGCKVITRPTNALANLIDSDSEPEKDAISVPKPRGGLLSRLQPQSSDDASESEEDEDGEGAYERIKKMLMSTSSEKEPKEQPAVATHSPVTGSSDEDDAPVRASNIRKRIARKAIRASASPTIPHSRQSSPGLFVTPDVSPAKNTLRATPAADSDINDSSHNADLQARVERIRAARRAKEDAPARQAFEEDLRKLAERREARRQKRLRDRISERLIDRDSESDSDGENGRRLTQHARPTRRAGKKAMEQMTRDQQRISRNMQLQHQAKTKKKYGTKDLFARFGFQQVDSELVPAETMLTTDASSMLASSDAEAGKHDDTPPTSPPTQEEHTELEKASLMETLTLQEDKLQNVSLSTPDMFSAPASNKGKGRAPEFQHLPINSLIEQLQVANMQNAHIQPKKPTVNEMVELSDSESEAKNVRKQSKRFPVFDRLPHKNQRDASSLLHLRNLANLTSPGKKTINGKSRINIGELNFSLATKARQQVQKERSERAEDLRRRGIHIETEEEREKHQLEVEDMVAQLEKAREQDRKLAKLEKAEAKKNGEIRDDIPSSDESEDEDYIGSGDEGAANVEEEDENEEELDLDLSGSEEEADDEDEDRMDAPNGLFDDAAAEDDDDEHEQNEVLTDEEMEDGGTIAPARKRTTTRARNVILDEDDSENEASQESTATKQASQPSQTQGNEAIDAFGFGNPSTSLGLTQMFAGTMANIESNSQNAHPLDDEPEQDSLDFLRGLPETQPGAFFSQPNDMLVPNSQAFESQDEQPQSMGINQLAPASPAFSQTQFSEAPEPTQDAGFLLSRSPAGLLPPPSTIDTVMMAVAESPIVKKKGRLQRRKQMMTAELSDVDEDIVASGTDGEEFAGNPETGDAFSVMKKAAKKQERVDNFNKKTSWARDVIEEQAEESEDEYAGLGGASDDDSADEDGELAEMIDTSDIKVDEGKIAAFFA